MSKWMVHTKKADFDMLAARYGIDKVTARIIRNRDVVSIADFDNYLGGFDFENDEARFKDIDKSVDIINDKIKAGKKIRIIGDYDIDGVCSIVILYKGLKFAGADVDYKVPHRIADGYGINEHLIDEALNDGIDTIVTCDNGIAAINQIKHAKDKGMTVVVTDHHDVPYVENDGVREYILPEADAIVNPKQKDCEYPFELICGATVAYKLIKRLFDKLGLDKDNLIEYKQLAAVATVGDVVDLKDENRAIVKFGLETIKDSKNIGLKTLINECKIDIDKITSYHIGFVIGPCLNASGRLDSAKEAVELLLETDAGQAVVKARRLIELNSERKSLTEAQTKLAIDMVENTELAKDNVIVLYLPDCHESIAGIIAGRIKEYFYKPSIVITNAETGAKGSGRSIEGYNMYERINECAQLLTKFGGHPMAAGLSLERENIDEFRRMLNEKCTLTEEELTAVTWIDVPMPLSYVTMELIKEFRIIEPFGKANPKPVFADKNLLVKSVRIMGTTTKVLKLMLQDERGLTFDGIMFRCDELLKPKVDDRIKIIYYPDINEYNGRKSIQFVINEWGYC